MDQEPPEKRRKLDDVPYGNNYSATSTRQPGLMLPFVPEPVGREHREVLSIEGLLNSWAADENVEMYSPGPVSQYSAPNTQGILHGSTYEKWVANEEQLETNPVLVEDDRTENMDLDSTEFAPTAFYDSDEELDDYDIWEAYDPYSDILQVYLFRSRN